MHAAASDKASNINKLFSLSWTGGAQKCPLIWHEVDPGLDVSYLFNNMASIEYAGIYRWLISSHWTMISSQVTRASEAWTSYHMTQIQIQIQNMFIGNI